MLSTLHREPPKVRAEGDRAYRAWLLREMGRRRIAAFVAESTEGGIVGSLVVWVRDSEPGPTNPKGRFPFLSTMFVEPAARRRGVATRLVRESVVWCRAQGFPGVTGIPVNHAPKVLRKLGFRELLPEMGLELGRKRQY
jgi:GNAT superfamily N-acetyltransferase